jgi:hypothetical protein
MIYDLSHLDLDNVLENTYMDDFHHLKRFPDTVANPTSQFFKENSYLELRELMLTVDYWIEKYFKVDDEFFALQVQTLISPKPEESKSKSEPVRDQLRLASLWKRWSSSLLNKEDNNVLSSSAFFLSPMFSLILFVFKRVFLGTGKSLVKSGFTHVVTKPWTGLVMKISPLRFLTTFVFGELVAVFSVWSLFSYAIVAIICLLFWLFNYDTTRFIPILVSPLVMSKDIYAGLFMPVMDFTPFWYKIGGLYLAMDMTYLYLSRDLIYSSLLDTMVNTANPYLAIPAWTLGTVFKYVIWPLVEASASPIVSPLVYLGKYTGFYDLSAYSPKFLLIKDLWGLLNNSFSNFILECNYLVSGIDHVTLSNSVRSHLEIVGSENALCDHKPLERLEEVSPDATPKAGPSSLPSIPGYNDPDSPVYNDYFKSPTMVQEAWGNTDSHDCVDPYVVVDAVETDSITKRLHKIVVRHPMLILSFGTSILYWGVKLTVLTVTASPVLG